MVMHEYATITQMLIMWVKLKNTQSNSKIVSSKTGLGFNILKDTGLYMFQGEGKFTVDVMCVTEN